MKKKPVEDKSIHFLIVDDDETVGDTIEEYVKSFGYAEISRAPSAEEAIHFLKKGQINFVISDWEMPGMSGLDLLQFMRNDANFKKIPFIMCTSQVSQEKLKIRHAGRYQANAYIVKPFRAQVLKEKIDSLMPKALVEKTFSERRAILIVDDDPGVMEVMIEYLNELGYSELMTARDGAEAFQVLEENSEEIALVLSDWEMPNMAGIDLLKKIRSHPQYNTIAFVMITSPTSIEKLKLGRAIDSEVDQYLLKPVRIGELKSKLELSLKKSKIMSEVKAELERAQNAFEASKWREAERSFNRVLKMQPQSIAARVGLARTLPHLNPEKGVDLAILQLSEAIQADPAAEEAHLELAAIFEKARSLDKAISYLQIGVRGCPRSARLRFHLGRLLFGKGKADEGLTQIKIALEIDSNYLEAKEFLANPNRKSSLSRTTKK